MKSLLLIPLIFCLGCSSSKKISSPFQTFNASQYQKPNTYEQHRAQQKSFRSSGQAIAYTDHGTGPALILIHGVPTSSWLYRKMIPSLQKKNRIITLDLLGYGSSSKPKNTGSNYTPHAQAKHVTALARHLKLESYSLLFHDMGGLVAWELLRKSPQSIDHLIALNTIIHEDGFHPPKMKPGSFTRSYTKAYANQVTQASVLGLTFWNMGLRGLLKLSKNACNGYAQPLSEGSDEALYVFFTSFNSSLFERLDSNQSHFRKFRGRTLVLWGAQDKTLTTEQLPFLTKHLTIPQKDIHIFPKNSHFLPEEIPKKLTSRVTNFLAE